MLTNILMAYPRRRCRRRAQVLLSLLLLPLFWLCSCAKRVRVALCPAVAVLSYPSGASSQVTVANRYLLERAAKEKVSVNVLSPVAADLIGRKTHLQRLETDYGFLVCAFMDPGRPNDYQNIYTTCMQNAGVWTAEVRSRTPENLLLPRTHYADVCVTTH
jgi:hypothetical protein